MLLVSFMHIKLHWFWLVLVLTYSMDLHHIDETVVMNASVKMTKCFQMILKISVSIFTKNMLLYY